MSGFEAFRTFKLNPEWGETNCRTLQLGVLDHTSKPKPVSLNSIYFERLRHHSALIEGNILSLYSLYFSAKRVAQSVVFCTRIHRHTLGFSFFFICGIISPQWRPNNQIKKSFRIKLFFKNSIRYSFDRVSKSIFNLTGFFGD
jgi:hypothetical protein